MAAVKVVPNVKSSTDKRKLRNDRPKGRLKEFVSQDRSEPIYSHSSRTQRHPLIY